MNEIIELLRANVDEDGELVLDANQTQLLLRFLKNADDVLKAQSNYADKLREMCMFYGGNL